MISGVVAIGRIAGTPHQLDEIERPIRKKNVLNTPRMARAKRFVR
jgi:hypothetical protein